MSVPKYRRTPSPIEYVDNAIKLEAFTGKMCARLPKRWRETRTRYICDIANEIVKEVVLANSIYAQNDIQRHERLIHLERAYGACYVLGAKLDFLVEENPKRTKEIKTAKTIDVRYEPCIKQGSFIHWAELINYEKKLIKGVMRSDKKQFDVRRKVCTSKRRTLYTN